MPLLPRREDPHDRRGHRRGPADGDRPRARCVAPPRSVRRVGGRRTGRNRLGAAVRALSGDARRRRGAGGGGSRPTRRASSPRPTRWRRAAGTIAGRRGSGSRCCSRPSTRWAGATLCVIVLAAVAALAFVLGAALARRVVPDPWATVGGAARGRGRRWRSGTRRSSCRRCSRARSWPARRCARSRMRERPLMRHAFGGAALLALLPWLDPWLLCPGDAGRRPARPLDRAARADADRARDGRDPARLARLLHLAQRAPLRRGLAAGRARRPGDGRVGGRRVPRARAAARPALRGPGLRGSCAGPRSWCSRSSARCCSRARGGSGWGRWSPTSATRSTPRSSRSPCARRRCWWPRSPCRRSRARGSRGASSCRRCRARSR